MPAPTNSVRRPSLSCADASPSERDDLPPRAALPLRGALELAEAFRPLECWLVFGSGGLGWGADEKGTGVYVCGSQVVGCPCQPDKHRFCFAGSLCVVCGGNLPAGSLGRWTRSMRAGGSGGSSCVRYLRTIYKLHLQTTSKEAGKRS